MSDEDDIARALEILRKQSERQAPVSQEVTFDFRDPDGWADAVIGRRTRYEPVGQNWKKPGNLVKLPQLKDHATGSWLIHERQDTNGKYKAWLFFSTATGIYYKQNGSGYEQMTTPNDPQEFPLSVRLGSATHGGTKLDVAVLLPELRKTGFLLKQPLEFLDRPAALFMLCTGLRCSAAASEFCAKRMHSVLMPKLSSRATRWDDSELMDLLRSTTEALDALILESPMCLAGCSIGLALQAGSRVVVGTMGSVRCILCGPNVSEASSKWSARLVADGCHSLSNPDERMRLESEGGQVLDGQAEVRAVSASEEALAAVDDEWEREVLRVTHATNSFAALGVRTAELKEGPAAIRRIFRRRSLVVHPDKVADHRKQQSATVFSRIEAAATAVEAMVQADVAAAVLVAQISYEHDQGRLAADPLCAAKLLGVQAGCSLKDAKEARKRKFEKALSGLQNVARRDVERSLKILDVAVESATRTAQLWMPESDGVRVTRALGCKDLKAPLPLLSASLTTEVVHLGPCETVGMVLIADSDRPTCLSTIAGRLASHSPGRPRAAALRLTLDESGAAPLGQQSSVSAVCAYFSHEEPGEVASGPPAKRARRGRPERVRVSHVLLKWRGLKGEDEFERPGKPAPTRTQAEAERELLELMEELLAAGDHKTLGARFKVEVLKRSECSTALNVPYADLGWVEPGGAEPAMVAAAFDTPAGGLSDVVTTSRGAHLMYRLA